MSDRDFLLFLADAADAVTMPLFRQPIGVDNKLEGDFDPVTEADRAAERAIRDTIRARYPQDAILGEEYGEEGESARKWVIDPIDGTRLFISGVPLWGTLVGLTEDGRATTGVMSQPFTGERFIAGPWGAEHVRHGEARPISVRKTTRIEDAVMFTTSPRHFHGEVRERFEGLEAATRLTRFGTDCYAFCMLASGHADLVVERDLKPYDIVALIPIIERAGGVVTDWSGGRMEEGGHLVAAATPELHAAALRMLNG
ncbi:histidinol-phosphatase [Fulvimarina sp. 2208YS6-2-32]|uniref:Histidinol-phosphatase n=1 Tax=Fulvimarina uroteuthidis TaxID=3098149 RepID=A0ABU5I577_9HYPH|nr:histidinol-phosphatase [Fulvimarina sp. 2208YS6-2-32]MDY8110550.1 histidinol-phosphatase [Fulvimarina sp. 2208YS6-2-32]